MQKYVGREQACHREKRDRKVPKMGSYMVCSRTAKKPEGATGVGGDEEREVRQGRRKREVLT